MLSPAAKLTKLSTISLGLLCLMTHRLHITNTSDLAFMKHFPAQINKDSLLEALKCCSHAPCTQAHSAPVNQNCPRVDYSLGKCFINADQTSAYLSLQTLLYGLEQGQFLFNYNNPHTIRIKRGFDLRSEQKHRRKNKSLNYITRTNSLQSFYEQQPQIMLPFS